MPDISIIIVSYNVSAFLQQCLHSIVKSSLQSVEIEIFVVDNNSMDNSVQVVKENFPEVKLIENKRNRGFAYACNQAIVQSSAKYILLLNPDTIIGRESLNLCKEFMDKNEDAGALGVKMIDGKGRFLLESKRSLPTVQSSFYKIFGLSSLFPKSKTFGQYQLKYLDKNQIHNVEVLSGAYMFIRKSVLDEVGLLDDSFFMYGEDIDLSYRIIKAGYKNVYFSKTTIIHYKGKSTKKASIKYVKLFYNAMLIFANKHYKGKKQFCFRFFIGLAVYFRAALALLWRLFVVFYSLMLKLIDLLRHRNNKIFGTSIKQTVIITGTTNINKITLENKLGEHYNVCDVVKYSKSDKYIGSLNRFIKLRNIETFIFITENLSSDNIIDTMLLFADKNLEFKIMFNENSCLLGA